MAASSFEAGTGNGPLPVIRNGIPTPIAEPVATALQRRVSNPPLPGGISTSIAEPVATAANRRVEETQCGDGSSVS